MILACPHCDFSKEIDPAKLPPNAKKATCPKCKQKFDIIYDEPASVQPAPPPPLRAEEMSPREQFRPRPDTDLEAAARAVVDEKTQLLTPKDAPPPLPPRRPFPSRTTGGTGTGIRWEDRTGSFFGDFFSTVWHILFRPNDFFDRMPTQGGKKAPLAFGVLAGTLVFDLAIFFLACLAVLASNTSFGMEFLASFQEQGIDLSTIPITAVVIGLLILMALVPLMMYIGLYLGALTLHIFLLIVRGAGSGFEATFRVMAYSTASYVFYIVPYLGQIVGGIWGFILIILGLPKAHHTGVGRVLIAVLVLPIILTMVIVGGSGLLVALLVGGAR
jgi:predicted Zn finger-like uncharacterized protein